jgi:hypothetical protein
MPELNDHQPFLNIILCNNENGLEIAFAMLQVRF